MGGKTQDREWRSKNRLENYHFWVAGKYNDIINNSK
jgi:hypothetical protein